MHCVIYVYDCSSYFIVLKEKMCALRLQQCHTSFECPLVQSSGVKQMKEMLQSLEDVSLMNSFCSPSAAATTASVEARDELCFCVVYQPFLQVL